MALDLPQNSYICTLSKTNSVVLPLAQSMWPLPGNVEILSLTSHPHIHSFTLLSDHRDLHLMYKSFLDTIKSPNNGPDCEERVFY